MLNTAPPTAETNTIRKRAALLRLPWAIFGTIWIALGLRLWRLDSLPGEFYGDIDIVRNYVVAILDRRWPTYFVLSAGPLYHYLIAPLIALLGSSYIGFKLASVVVSGGVLGATWLLARELGGSRLALVATFIASVSSWLLVFSRLGNSQILVPLLAIGSIWLLIRAVRYGHTRDVIACAFVSALGLYTYPQSFVLPPVIGATVLLLGWTHGGVTRRHVLIFAAATLVCAIPFAFIVARDPANFFTGYIGGKLDTGENPIGTLLGNVWHGLLAFHLRGDIVFRSNPPRLPLLDVLSGILFLVGIVFWLMPERRRIAPALLVPLVLLQVPSWLVLSNPIDVPSASRSLAVAPLAYLLAANGLLWIVDRMRSFRWQSQLALAGALLTILALNAERYFVRYADGLPNGNTPFGRIIAEYITTLPAETNVVLVGCCWGDWGQPEPSGIRWALPDLRPIEYFPTDEFGCDQLANLPRPVEIIWHPREAAPSPSTAACAADLAPVLHLSARDEPVFQSATLLP
jgi:hypothetical protein